MCQCGTQALPLHLELHEALTARTASTILPAVYLVPKGLLLCYACLCCGVNLQLAAEEESVRLRKSFLRACWPYTPASRTQKPQPLFSLLWLKKIYILKGKRLSFSACFRIWCCWLSSALMQALKIAMTVRGSNLAQRITSYSRTVLEMLVGPFRSQSMLHIPLLKVFTLPLGLL